MRVVVAADWRAHEAGAGRWGRLDPRTCSKVCTGRSILSVAQDERDDKGYYYDDSNQRRGAASAGYVNAWGQRKSFPMVEGLSKDARAIKELKQARTKLAAQLQALKTKLQLSQ